MYLDLITKDISELKKLYEEKLDELIRIQKVIEIKAKEVIEHGKRN